MSSYQRILELIKSVNPAAASLQAEHLAFDDPQAFSHNGRNTAVLLTAKPYSGYAGSVTVYYSRTNLATIANTIVLTLPAGFTMQTLVESINTQYGVSLEERDLAALDTTGMTVGWTGTVSLQASAVSFMWFGSVLLNLTITESTAADVALALQQISDLATEFHDYQASNAGDGSALLRSTKINNTALDMYLGQAVYATASNGIAQAQANDLSKTAVIGLVSDSLIQSGGNAGKIQTHGILIGTAAEWEIATGMVGGLIPGSTYFLDNIAGRITPYAPLEDGSSIISVGKAISTTEFSIAIGRPIIN